MDDLYFDSEYAEHSDYNGLSSLYDYNAKPVKITDQSIEKVKTVSLKGYTDNQLENLKESHKIILEVAKDQNNHNEVARIAKINGDDSVLILGDSNKVLFNDNLDARRIIIMSPVNSIVVSHNHPNCTTFSYDDLEVMLNSSVKTLTIVTNKGKVLALNKTKIVDGREVVGYIDSVKQKYSDFKKDQPKIVEEILKGLGDFGIEYIK